VGREEGRLRAIPEKQAASCRRGGRGAPTVGGSGKLGLRLGGKKSNQLVGTGGIFFLFDDYSPEALTRAASVKYWFFGRSFLSPHQLSFEYRVAGLATDRQSTHLLCGSLSNHLFPGTARDPSRSLGA